MVTQQWLAIPPGQYVYRVRHRIMEGDCPGEHGPVLVRIPAFEIMKYPVTNGMFREFLDSTGYHADGNFLLHWKTASLCPDNAPVVYVSLEDAQAYAAYVGGTLPTERQWQYAAGGADGRRWPWGNDFDPAKVNGDGGVLMAVDAHPDGESPLGVADLCGNAWEWTLPVQDDGHHRFALIRGGCCYRAPHFWHMEGGAQPVDAHAKVPLVSGNLNRASTVGFRCVRGG